LIEYKGNPINNLNIPNIKKLLQPILWDYEIDPFEFYQVAIGKKKMIGLFNQERALIRILERLNWFDVLTLLGINFLKENLSSNIVNKLRIGGLRRRYEIVQKILRGEPVSFSKWNSETRKRLRHSILSHRWYRY
jgi:hypothetical protein